MAAALGLLVLTTAATAQTSNSDIDAAREQQAEEQRRAEDFARDAARIEAELNRQRATLKDLATAIRTREAALNQLESALAGKQAEISEQKGRLVSAQGLIARSLSALAGLAQAPPLAAIARPGESAQAHLAASALAGIQAGLDQRMADLATLLNELEDRQAELAALRSEAENGVAALRHDRAALNQQIAKRRDLARASEAKATAARKRVKALADEVETLTALMQRLDALQPVAAPSGAPQQTGFGRMKGKMPLPAVGLINSGFGQQDPTYGPDGLVIRTRKDAIVTAPHDAIVRFAAPFRHYGPLLILDFGDGYHLLVAGLSGIDVVPGQWLLAGEPVGRMSPGADEAGDELYMELRRGGSPIDPTPWLAKRQGRSNG